MLSLEKSIEKEGWLVVARAGIAENEEWLLMEFLFGVIEMFCN